MIMIYDTYIHIASYDTICLPPLCTACTPVVHTYIVHRYIDAACLIYTADMTDYLLLLLLIKV